LTDVLHAAQAATAAIETTMFAGVPDARQRDYYDLALAAYRRL
jgi:hypothetical protein